jgi:hypothetical protein
MAQLSMSFTLMLNQFILLPGAINLPELEAEPVKSEPGTEPENDENSFEREIVTFSIDISHHAIPMVVSEMPSPDTVLVRRRQRRGIGSWMHILL